MLASVAVVETAKPLAFDLIDHGYRQARQSVVCPICGTKYLVLLDCEVFERESEITEAAQTTALDYFTEKLREAHPTGHCEQKLEMVWR